MKASIQNLIQEFKAVVFEKDELEFRDMSEIKALLRLLAYQDSNSNVEIIFQNTQKPTICFRYRAIEIDTLMEKKRNKLSSRNETLNSEVYQD